MAYLKGVGHIIYVLKIPRHQDLPERAVSKTEIQAGAMTNWWKYKSLHHWQSDKVSPQMGLRKDMFERMYLFSCALCRSSA